MPTQNNVQYLRHNFFKKLFIMSLLAVGTVAFDDIETPMGRAELAIGGAATYITLAASH
jgi:hypothetical protein